MPFQATLSPYGPQNIDEGEIHINGKIITELENQGFTPYTSETFEELCTKKGLKTNETTEFKLEGVYTSSSQVINGLMDDVCRSIDE